MTLEGTPQLVTPSGVAGLAFRDEAQTVNKYVPILKRQGVETIVVLIHEGGFTTGTYNDCTGISGPIVEIGKRLQRRDRRRRQRPHASGLQLHDRRQARHERRLVRPDHHGHRPHDREHDR